MITPENMNKVNDLDRSSWTQVHCPISPWPDTKGQEYVRQPSRVSKQKWFDVSPETVRKDFECGRIISFFFYFDSGWLPIRSFFLQGKRSQHRLQQNYHLTSILKQSEQ